MEQPLSAERAHEGCVVPVGEQDGDGFWLPCRRMWAKLPTGCCSWHSAEEDWEIPAGKLARLLSGAEAEPNVLKPSPVQVKAFKVPPVHWRAVGFFLFIVGLDYIWTNHIRPYWTRPIRSRLIGFKDTDASVKSQLGYVWIHNPNSQSYEHLLVPAPQPADQISSYWAVIKGFPRGGDWWRSISDEDRTKWTAAKYIPPYWSQ